MAMQNPCVAMSQRRDPQQNQALQVSPAHTTCSTVFFCLQSVLILHPPLAPPSLAPVTTAAPAALAREFRFIEVNGSAAAMPNYDLFLF
jgi:hypothetical protein